MSASEEYHLPVMLNETVSALINNPDGVYVDATYGGGGHSREVLRRLGKNGKLYAFDQDTDALKNDMEDPRLILVHSNFRFVGQWMRYYGVEHVDGIMADLGVSSFQLDEKTKGFSYSAEAELDMRMNVKGEVSAINVINDDDEESLVKMFSQYGEVRNAKSLAKAIMVARAQRPIENVQEFLHGIDAMVMGNRARYLSQVFQAIRIKVNDEIGSLRAMLATSADLLLMGGKLVILTYHSIEDREVKHFMKRGSSGKDERGEDDPFGVRRKWPMKMLTKKPILPSEAEILKNRRARSAKLRVAEKTGQ